MQYIKQRGLQNFGNLILIIPASSRLSLTSVIAAQRVASVLDLNDLYMAGCPDTLTIDCHLS